jgi:hypothetical protein
LHCIAAVVTQSIASRAGNANRALIRREQRLYEFLQRDIDYVIRLDEILWGCGLLAVTLVIHGVGLFQVVRSSAGLLAQSRISLPGLRAGVFVLTILTIVVLHLLEVMVWAAFFTWKSAQPNASSAFYNALVNYTTLGAGYLPIRWRLLEGMLGMAGLLCFAFSTSALLALAQQIVHLPFNRQVPAADSARRDAKSS